MNDAMAAEFDTLAEWTAEVALDLGPEHYLPAGCRGSGSPGVLRWLVDRLGLRAKDRMLDCGAGVGGPAAFAEAEAGVRPVLTDPEAGACRAAHRLFGLPVVRAAGPLPFALGSFDVVWSLGVLCTVPDQPAFLAELRRVLAPGGRLGLLVFVAKRLPLVDQPEGNTFPTVDRLDEMLTDAGFTTTDSARSTEFAGVPDFWEERTAAVEGELVRRYGDQPAWRIAASQSRSIGRLLASGDLEGTLLTAQPTHGHHHSAR